MHLPFPRTFTSYELDTENSKTYGFCYFSPKLFTMQTQCVCVWRSRNHLAHIVSIFYYPSALCPLFGVLFSPCGLSLDAAGRGHRPPPHSESLEEKRIRKVRDSNIGDVN